MQQWKNKEEKKCFVIVLIAQGNLNRYTLPIQRNAVGNNEGFSSEYLTISNFIQCKLKFASFRAEFFSKITTKTTDSASTQNGKTQFRKALNINVYVNHKIQSLLEMTKMKKKAPL